MGFVWILLVVCALAPAALAADGSSCSIDTHYTAGRGRCMILDDGATEAVANADTTPVATHELSNGQTTTVIAFGRCPTSCEPGSAIVCESDSAVVGAPNVCNIVGTLTGCGTTLVSELVTRRVTKNYVWVDWVADITDTDCSGSGVDVTITFLP